MARSSKQGVPLGSVLRLGQIKVPSTCEPFCEPSPVPSCEEKGSVETSPNKLIFIYMQVHVKVQVKLQVRVHEG